MTMKTTSNIRENHGAGTVVRYAGHCQGCEKRITAQTRKQWQRAMSSPCPHCGTKGWRTWTR